MSAVGFHTGYFDQALNDLDRTVELMYGRLINVEHDTLIGTGFSGGIVIPYLAIRLGKNFALLRKATDDSHHGSGCLVGNVGERWVFVDDFISTGATRRRVVDRVSRAMRTKGAVTTYVGDYLYREQQFVTNYADAINEEQS